MPAGHLQDPGCRVGGFRHEALFYEGQDDFLGRVAPFVREGAESEDAVLVALPEPRLGALRTELGSMAERVTFTDMGTVGKNPGRILSVWDQFSAWPAGRVRPGSRCRRTDLGGSHL